MRTGRLAWVLIPYPILPPSLMSHAVSMDVKHHEKTPLSPASSSWGGVPLTQRLKPSPPLPPTRTRPHCREPRLVNIKVVKLLAFEFKAWTGPCVLRLLSGILSLSFLPFMIHLTLSFSTPPLSLSLSPHPTSFPSPALSRLYMTFYVNSESEISLLVIGRPVFCPDTTSPLTGSRSVSVVVRPQRPYKDY